MLLLMANAVLENGVKLGNKPHKPIQLLDYLPANASGLESSGKRETTFSYLFLGNLSCFLDQYPTYQTIRCFGMRYPWSLLLTHSVVWMCLSSHASKDRNLGLISSKFTFNNC